MFKKVLQSLTKSFSKSTTPDKPVAAKAVAAPVVIGTAPAPRTESPLKKIAAPPAPAPARPMSSEELCGIEPKMNKEQIRDRLKLLYRRYNRAASSLDTKTRAEADAMLDAIVHIREKTFGEI